MKADPAVDPAGAGSAEAAGETAGEAAGEAAGEVTASLIDTHCHLDLMEVDPAAAVAAATAAGVSTIITIGIDLASSARAVELASEFPEVYAAVGMHPHEGSAVNDDVMGRLRELAAHPKVVAIGETGLDFYRNRSPHADQERSFRSHIELARDLTLPLIVHDREAHEQTLAILRDAQLSEAAIVMHCFSGDLAMAEACLALGCYISIAGPVTFRNARRLQEVVPELPLSRLLLETDSPFLAPHPHRGKPNSPAMLPLIARAIADLLTLPPASVASATSANAQRVFGL